MKPELAHDWAAAAAEALYCSSVPGSYYSSGVLLQFAAPHRQSADCHIHRTEGTELPL
jgi:hypothetical protein